MSIEGILDILSIEGILKKKSKKRKVAKKQNISTAPYFSRPKFCYSCHVSGGKPKSGPFAYKSTSRDIVQHILPPLTPPPFYATMKTLVMSPTAKQIACCILIATAFRGIEHYLESVALQTLIASYGVYLLLMLVIFNALVTVLLLLILNEKQQTLCDGAFDPTRKAIRDSWVEQLTAVIVTCIGVILHASAETVFFVIILAGLLFMVYCSMDICRCICQATTTNY